MSKFFISRPIVATVISIVTVIAGLVAMLKLPVAQLPDIVPPQINVSATYTGADALTIEQSVATPLEQAARKRPELASLVSTFRPSVPQLFVDVDQDRILKQGLQFGEVFQTLQAFLGGAYVNQFNRFGRQWKVYLQAEPQFRNSADQISNFYVRNSVEAYRESVRLSSIRYDSGLASYLEIIDAQIQMYPAERSAIIYDLGPKEALVNLYRALGGGWNLSDSRWTSTSGTSAPAQSPTP
jgi:multidrug efflux pump subunit AcrB